jgi:hypothetical protein
MPIRTNMYLYKIIIVLNCYRINDIMLDKTK